MNVSTLLLGDFGGKEVIRFFVKYSELLEVKKTLNWQNNLTFNLVNDYYVSWRHGVWGWTPI